MWCSQLIVFDDWTLYIKPWFTRFDLTSCEMKPPKKVGRGDTSDFVKIGQELKETLDSLLQIGVHDAPVFGILVKGIKISFYGMGVVGNVYRRYQIANSQLITKIFQPLFFPSLFDIYVQINWTLGLLSRISTMMT
ncbi:hypothetical protein K501DRAFT_313557 [Backusella circina FSU 941]|nr:hypothetical protein K501DRAFT_313557 [Backusella circina FSU 941]